MAPTAGVDVVVVGAGAVGLAAASALARSGRSVLVMERHGGVAREVTSRNSQVIHAGIYSPPGSLKSTLCTRGRELLYPWLEGRGVAHRKVGKLIVAVDESEEVRIAGLLDRGLANGVPGLVLLGAREVRAREPRVVGSGALYSPESGIVDALGFALSRLADGQLVRAGRGGGLKASPSRRSRASRRLGARRWRTGDSRHSGSGRGNPLRPRCRIRC